VFTKSSAVTDRSWYCVRAAWNGFERQNEAAVAVPVAQEAPVAVEELPLDDADVAAARHELQRKQGMPPGEHPCLGGGYTGFEDGFQDAQTELGSL